MWPPKEHLDNVQFRNKGAMVQTDQSQRPSSALSLSISTSCAFWATLTGCPSVSWNCCCDNFISPALTLQAVIHSFQRVPQFGYKILWSIGRLFARDIQRDKTVSFYPSAALHCFVCLYPVVSFPQQGPQVHSSPFSLPVKEITECFDVPVQRLSHVFTHTDDLRTAGMCHMIVEEPIL